jgi:branched-subunit amino acid transport protein
MADRLKHRPPLSARPGPRRTSRQPIVCRGVWRHRDLRAERLVGPLARWRLRLPARFNRLLAAAAAVLLTALVAAAALTQGHGFAGWARPAGVLVGGILAQPRVAFPLVIIAAAVTTAVLRLSSVP